MKTDLDTEKLTFRIRELIALRFRLEDQRLPADARAALLMDSDFTELECVGAALLLGLPMVDLMRFDPSFRARVISKLLTDTEGATAAAKRIVQ